MYITHIDADEYFLHNICYEMPFCVCNSIILNTINRFYHPSIYIDFRRTFKIVKWHILIIKGAKTVDVVETPLSISYYVDYLSF